MHLKFGRSIQHLRKRKDFTQQQIADLLFVSRSTYAGWESNSNEITFNKLLSLIDIYKISILDFIGLVEMHNHIDLSESYQDPAIVQIMKRLENIEQLLQKQNDTTDPFLGTTTIRKDS